MLGLGKPSPIAEHEAHGETEELFHDIRQTLRVSGVNLIFRTWAGADGLLPVVWDALRPTLATRAFEDAADRVRDDALRAAAALGRLDAARSARLGESQAFQLRAALDLYRYATPKLLVLTSALRRALDGERGAPAGGGRVARGVPPGMFPMEMVPEDTDEEPVHTLFRDIRKTLGLSRVNSLYRTVALWPDYLEPAWAAVRPVAQDDAYARAAEGLRVRSRELARGLAVPLSPERVKEAGADAAELDRTVDEFESLIPGVILNTHLFALDWAEADALAGSPFPAGGAA